MYFRKEAVAELVASACLPADRIPTKDIESSSIIITRLASTTRIGLHVPVG